MQLLERHLLEAELGWVDGHTVDDPLGGLEGLHQHCHKDNQTGEQSREHHRCILMRSLAVMLAQSRLHMANLTAHTSVQLDSSANPATSWSSPRSWPHPRGRCSTRRRSCLPPRPSGSKRDGHGTHGSTHMQSARTSSDSSSELDISASPRE